MIHEHYAHELTGDVDDEGYILYALRRWLNVKSERSELFVRRKKTSLGSVYCVVLYENEDAARLYQRFAKGCAYLTPDEFVKWVGEE